MYFTLAVSAATADTCALLTDRARVTDPRIMPIPGPATVAWRSGDGRAAVLHWGGTAVAGAMPASSQAGTIWTADHGAPVCALTSMIRVNPVYAAELPGAVILSDRAIWAAAAADRLGGFDAAHACGLLNPGFPLGSTTPWRGVSALPPATSAHVISGTLSSSTASLTAADGASAADVAAALVAAVKPLRTAGEPVELSLTGGKDSRLVAAALVAARVPVRARTHGFAEHPDVQLATEVARRLGIDHAVTAPAAPGQQTDVAGRLRATVLVADGMLSAFENVGRPDPAGSPALTVGGHGGELLRGGYAEVTVGRRAAPLRAAEVLRRLTTRHIGLLRPGAAASYLASLTPWTGTALAHGPLQALDDFYLVNRAGRWSAAARQAFLIRERLVQPLFDERVVKAARAVPLADRANGTLAEAVLAELSPALKDVPLAGKPARGTVPATFDWRRQYGSEVAAFLRDYTIDLGASGGLFDVVSRSAAEKALRPPQPDRATVWALATLACLFSGDYRNAREPSASLSVS